MTLDELAAIIAEGPAVMASYHAMAEECRALEHKIIARSQVLNHWLARLATALEQWKEQGSSEEWKEGPPPD